MQISDDMRRRTIQVVRWSALWIAALTVFGACQPCFTGATIDTDRPLLLRTWGGKPTLSLRQPTKEGRKEGYLQLPGGRTPVAIWQRSLIYWSEADRELAISTKPEETIFLPLQKVLPKDTYLQSFCSSRDGVYLNVTQGNYSSSPPYGVLFLALPSRKLSWGQGLTEVRTNALGASYGGRDRQGNLSIYNERGKTILYRDTRGQVRSWDYDPATGRLAYVQEDQVVVLDRNGKTVLARGIVGVGMPLMGVRLPPEPHHPIWLIQGRIAHVYGAMELSEKGEVRGWRYLTLSGGGVEFIQSLDDDTYKWLSGYLTI